MRMSLFSLLFLVKLCSADQFTQGDKFPGFRQEGEVFVNTSSASVAGNCINFPAEGTPSLVTASAPVAIPVGFSTVTVAGLSGSPRYIRVRATLAYTEDGTAASHNARAILLDNIWSQNTPANSGAVAVATCKVALAGDVCNNTGEGDVYLDTVTFNRFMFSNRIPSIETTQTLDIVLLKVCY